MLLSNLPYYAQHGYGLELFDRWVETGEASAIPSSLRLYREVRDLGFKTFLPTGRSEAHEGRKSCRGPAMRRRSTPRRRRSKPRRKRTSRRRRPWIAVAGVLRTWDL